MTFYPVNNLNHYVYEDAFASKNTNKSLLTSKLSWFHGFAAYIPYSLAHLSRWISRSVLSRTLKGFGGDGGP